MIGAQIAGASGLAARLASQAGRIASAALSRSALARSDDPARWRRAGLLWPTFTSSRNGD